MQKPILELPDGRILKESLSIGLVGIHDKSISPLLTAFLACSIRQIP